MKTKNKTVKNSFQRVIKKYKNEAFSIKIYHIFFENVIVTKIANNTFA